MDTAGLKLIGIKKSFPGVLALQGIDLAARRGEIVALVGANGAGKSTLMNVLGGVIPMDEGQIEIDGKVVQLHSPRDAKDMGIAFVHQEMALLPTLTIIDNMFMSGFPKSKSRLIDYKFAEQRCSEILERFDCPLDPRTKVKDLGAGDRQMVEIARALLSNPQIIIFDEATSSLSNTETDRLFSVIRMLKSQGTTILYITHFLDEIFELCDKAVVLRNGKVSGESSIAELTPEKLVGFMLGQVVQKDRMPTEKDHSFVGNTVFRASGVSRRGVIDDISLELRSGEVLGLWGLLGSGRTELARILAGLDSHDDGAFEVREQNALRPLARNDLKGWVGLITENRREDGLLGQCSVRTNISLASLESFTRPFWPFINEKHEKEVAQRYIDELGIKTPSMEQAVSNLSGGNQQKVILGRWLQKNPSILIMDEPTRGLDIGAKLEMQSRVRALAKQGTAILVISSEIEEMMALSDRYIVIDRGRIVGEFGHGASKEELLHAAVGAK